MKPALGPGRGCPPSLAQPSCLRAPGPVPVSSPFCTVKGMTRLKGLSMDSMGSAGTTGSSVACGRGEEQSSAGEGMGSLA